MKKDEIIYSLSHLNATNIGDSSQKGIIIDTIYHKGRGILKADLINEIKDLFHIEILQDTVNSIVDHLIDDKILYFDKEGKLWISPDTNDFIYKNKQFFERLENEVIEEWVAGLPIEYQKDSDNYKIAIRNFINALFIKHGVVSYTLISENAHYNEFDIQAIAKEVASHFDELKDTMPAVLIEFLTKPIPEKRLTYLKIVIEKAISYLSCVVQPEIIESVIQSINGLVIYLDTSFLYRILNLQGDERYKAVCNVVKISQEFGIVFRVSTKTFLELQSRIAFDASVVVKYPIRVDLAAVGYNYKTDDNYVSTFWKASKETGISISDFNEKYKQAKILLEEFGIIVETTPIIEDSLFLEETRDVFSKISSYESQTEDPKSNNAIWHDAYNITYVYKQQNLTASNIIESRCLFMTTDKSILKIQTNDYYFKDKPIISILPSQLLQIICFIKPCDDFYMTFIDFFSSASNNYHNGCINNDVINEILGRISHYSGGNPEVARKILENQYLINKFISAKGDGEKEEIIYNTVTDILTELLTESKEDLHLKEEELQAQQIENQDLSSEVESLRFKVNELSEELDKNSKISEININLKIDDISILKDIYASSKWKKWRNIRIGSLTGSIILIFYAAVLIYNRFFKVIEVSAGTDFDYSNIDMQLVCVIPIIIGLLPFGFSLFKGNIKHIIKKGYEEEFENDLAEKRKKFKE